MENLVGNWQIYEEGYDIKLYTLTMSKLLGQLGKEIFSVKLIESMVSLLMKQQSYEVR